MRQHNITSNNSFVMMNEMSQPKDFDSYDTNNFANVLKNQIADVKNVINEKNETLLSSQLEMNKIDRKNVNEFLSAYNSGSILHEEIKQNNPLLADSIQLSGGPE